MVTRSASGPSSLSERIASSSIGSSVGGDGLDDDGLGRRRPRPGPWRRRGTPRRPARSSGSRSSTSASRRDHRARAAGDLVEQLVHAVGEDLHLRLLQRDAHRAAAVVGGLQVEGAVARAGPRCRRRSGSDGRRDGPDGARDQVTRATPRPSPDDTEAGQAVVPAPPPTTASEDALPRRRLRGGGISAGDVAAGVVDADDERPGLGVGDHRDRRRVDDDPLELVEVQAQRVGQDRLDDVAVAAGQPDGVGAELRVPVADGGDRAGLRLRQPLPLGAGEDRGRRVLLHDLPERLLGQLLDRSGRSSRRSGPRRAGRRSAPSSSRPGGDGVRGLQAALERAADDRGERHLRQPLRHRRDLRRAGLVELHARGPAGEDAAGVGRRPAVPQEEDGGHGASLGAGLREPAQVGSRTPGADQREDQQRRARPGRRRTA